jgi:hypothetical protein
MNQKAHGIVEDLGAEIGYTATAALVDWFGGGTLHVPKEFDPGHAICKVIGEPAFRRLIRWVDSLPVNLLARPRLIQIPLGYQREQDRRDRMIAVLLAGGYGSKQVAAIAGMTERHVQMVRARVEAMGILPLILRKAGMPEKTRKRRV